MAATAVEKMRATQGSGRQHQNGKSFSKDHNDRRAEQALDNVDPTKTPDNLYFNYFENAYYDKDKDNKMTFEEAQLKVYQKMFKKQYEQQMSKYKAHGNYKKVVSFEEWINQKRHRPEQVWLQIGDKDNHPTAIKFEKAFIEYYHAMIKWNKDHGYPFSITDFAIHVDEATPHAQLNRVWKYKDNDGVWKIGQEEALKRVGVPLPDPTKPESRYNNRKMTFDAEMRQIWLDAIEHQGIDIERIPLPNGNKRHKEKEDHIRDKYNELLKENERLQHENAQMIQKQYDLAVLERKIAEKDEKASEYLQLCKDIAQEAMNISCSNKRIAKSLENDKQREVYNKSISDNDAKLNALLKKHHISIDDDDEPKQNNHDKDDDLSL